MLIGYMGYAHCRSCSLKNNGSSDIVVSYKNTKWIFPEGYLHYIKDHNVKPSKGFQDFIMNVLPDNLDNLSMPVVTEEDRKMLRTLRLWRFQDGLGGLAFSN